MRARFLSKVIPVHTALSSVVIFVFCRDSTFKSDDRKEIGQPAHDVILLRLESRAICRGIVADPERTLEFLECS